MPHLLLDDYLEGTAEWLFNWMLRWPRFKSCIVTIIFPTPHQKLLCPCLAEIFQAPNFDASENLFGIPVRRMSTGTGEGRVKKLPEIPLHTISELFR